MFLTRYIWDVYFLQTFELGLAPIGVILRKDMTLAEEFLKSLPGDFPRGHLEDLSVSLQSLQTAFSSLHALSSERMNHIMLAIDSEMVGTRPSHVESELVFGRKLRV